MRANRRVAGTYIRGLNNTRLRRDLTPSVPLPWEGRGKRTLVQNEVNHPKAAQVPPSLPRGGDGGEVSHRRGVALVLAMWMLVALLLLAGGLAMKVRADVQVSRNFADLLRCRWAAVSGINYTLIQLKELIKEPAIYLGEEGLMISSDPEVYELDDLTFDVAVTDEAGKVNINTASADLLEALFGSREIAESIIDWRDTDDNPGPQGAENEYYASLPHPYKCKNAPFDTVEELLLVKGIVRDMLTKPAEDETLPLGACLTIYSVDKNQTVDGKARVNIKTADQNALKSALGEVLTDDDITAVVQQRGSFDTAGDIINVAGISREKVEQIYDLLTVTDEKTLRGLININTAPLKVLVALPGMDSDTANAIIEHRQSNGPFADVGQLLTVSGVSSDMFAEMADKFTVRSQIFQIASTGHRSDGWATRTVTCVVDFAASSTTQTVYWRE